jgi:hypothetical protein
LFVFRLLFVLCLYVTGKYKNGRQMGVPTHPVAETYSDLLAGSDTASPPG